MTPRVKLSNENILSPVHEYESITCASLLRVNLKLLLENYVILPVCSNNS